MLEERSKQRRWLWELEKVIGSKESLPVFIIKDRLKQIEKAKLELERIRVKNSKDI